MMVFIIVMMTLSCTVSKYQPAPVPVNQLSKDKRGNDMLIGQCTRAALVQPPFEEWFQANYDSYTVDSFTCTFISPLLKDKTITIFLGTWCGDSKREVPRFLKMLDCCGFPEDRIILVMLSNQDSAYKMSPQRQEAGKNIVRVPTMIIEENGKEIGRIIEFPKISLEKDLLAILRQEPYKPNYDGMKINASAED